MISKIVIANQDWGCMLCEKASRQSLFRKLLLVCIMFVGYGCGPTHKEECLFTVSFKKNSIEVGYNIPDSNEMCYLGRNNENHHRSALKNGEMTINLCAGDYTVAEISRQVGNDVEAKIRVRRPKEIVPEKEIYILIDQNSEKSSYSWKKIFIPVQHADEWLEIDAKISDA